MNGNTQEVCCAEVGIGSPEYKDCTAEGYKVVWKLKEGSWIKIREVFKENEKVCDYSFWEDGEVEKECYDPNVEEFKPTSREDCGDKPPYKKFSFGQLTPEEEREYDQLMKDTRKWNDCIYEVGKATNDKGVCMELIGNSDPKFCYTDTYCNLCISDVACDTGDITICDGFKEVQGPRNAGTVLCYKCVAIFSKDLSICAVIQDTGVKSDCYVEVGFALDDSSVCSKINPNAILNKQKYNELC